MCSLVIRFFVFFVLGGWGGGGGCFVFLYVCLLVWLYIFFRTNPVTWEGQEFLLVPVGLEDDQDFYGGLYSEESDDDDSSTL